MNSKDLQVGDWVTIPWIAYKLYIVSVDDDKFHVSSPSWRVGDTMKFKHWQFREEGTIKNLGKGKPNPLYNKITKLSGFVHPTMQNV